ncbi:chondroitin proteoglycan 2-like [Lates japonicus]|uniref:Chondroitin proteoglycan 2-like protein n=1 Tax=Lates japonicus TaxID=270547 RepID=A0AAD3RI58_LATJO|nr:chondroitin proteoglycan 2-like protein [Lates japonicus]
MAQELELSDYATVHELKGTETNSSDNEPPERRLLRIGILTLAVLCLIQATLNISLRLALNSREDTVELPFNSSMIADLCQSQQSPTQSCSCCNNLLHELLKSYRELETKRDTLQDMVIKMSKSEEVSGSGYNSLEFLDLEGHFS